MPEQGLVLVGMPGSGKSTVGRLVAERLGRPFVDTDALIERRQGMAVPAYLDANGEPAFRRVEAAAVAEACAVPGAVIAAGGGAALDPLNRWVLWHHGTVAWLAVASDELVRRLSADRMARPTFEPYQVDRLDAVLSAREPIYRAADRRVDASRAPTDIATELAREVARRGEPPRQRRLFDAQVDRHLTIGPRTARVVFGLDLDLDSLVPPGVAVVDRRLKPSFVGRLPARGRLAVSAGERAKRMRNLERVLLWMADERVERGEPMIAAGGGTIGDLAGTAAALFARGIPLIQVPTTWLAQADSAIGGKVAIDIGPAKNAAGSFWPPVAVVADVAALRTLPVSFRRDGIAESIKAALIGEASLWDLLESRGRPALHHDEAARYAIIERSARLKLDVCARDPFETTDERRVLNLGHTIGHALEIESGYRLRHGAAVALGLRAVAHIAVGRGADASVPGRLDSLLSALGFALRRDFDADAVRDAIRGDKKRKKGRQRWILPMRIGRVVEADNVSDAELDRALRTIAA